MLPAPVIGRVAAGEAIFLRSLRVAPPPIDFGVRRAMQRGLYRVFNAAVYRFYINSSRPPAPSDAPSFTNSTLAYTPSTAYGNGTYYLSVSYFDGVLDSGFLPLGPLGQTYLTMQISGGVLIGPAPSGPLSSALIVRAGGLVQIMAAYNPAVDGINAATVWAIAYTTDGSTPPSGNPSITMQIFGGGLAMLNYDLPAQTGGTVVKVILQTRRGAVYSAATLLTATALTAGPTAPADLKSYEGSLPNTF